MIARLCRALLPVLALVAGALAPTTPTLAAGAQDTYVPVSEEPSHHVRFDRAYRMVLGPGESTDAFTRSANTAVFAVSGGRTSERAEGRAPRLWDPRPGDFRWVEASERLVIRNEGKSAVEFVEIEMF